jgi:hypothetical protein
LAKANYDGGSLFDGFIPNYDNDTNPLAKTGYDDVGSFAAPIVNLELLLETIPKVDAKPEAKKNNTTIDIGLMQCPQNMMRQILTENVNSAALGF